MKLINLLSKIVSEQPSPESKFIRKGLVTSEEYDGNIFELYTGKHGVDRSIRPENTSDVTKIDIIDKFKKATPELNKRFFGKIRNQKSPIVDKKWEFKDAKNGKKITNPSPSFVVVDIKDDFFQMVLMINNYDKNSNYVSFEIVTILKNGTPLSNLYNPNYNSQKLNIFLEHVVKSEIIRIWTIHI
jgi:hypothetical protein